MERKMFKEELSITIPSFFRCPISMDLMKSPVSLCTGVTYDRSSIQQWLESGQDTCPATMQVLPSKDFIPNLTLHRLINLWIQSSPRPGSDSPRLLQPASPSISEVQARVLIDKIDKESCVESLSKVAKFGSRGEKNRGFITRFGNTVEIIAGVLRKKCVEIEALEWAVRVLGLILNDNGVKERLNNLILNSNQEDDFLSSIILILQNGTVNSKIESVRVLDSIAFDAESKRRIAASRNLIQILLHLLKTTDNNNQTLTDAIITFLTTISISRSVKSYLIENGAVESLSKSITEKSLKLLAILCTCSEGRSAMSSEPKCAARIVEKLLKLSKTATEDAVLVLWSLCCMIKDEKVKEEVIKGNGVVMLLVIMQREGEGNVKMMCRDLVKAFKVGYKDWCLGSYDTKTTHIRPC